MSTNAEGTRHEIEWDITRSFLEPPNVKDMVECCDMKSWPRIISELRWGRTKSFTSRYHSPRRFKSTVHYPLMEALSDDDAMDMLPAAGFICSLCFLTKPREIKDPELPVSISAVPAPFFPTNTYNAACFRDPKEVDVVFDINIVASLWEHVAADVIFGFERLIFEKWLSFLHLKQVAFLAAHTLLLWRDPPQKKHVYLVLAKAAQYVLMVSVDRTLVLVFSRETAPTIGVWVYVYASEFFWAAWSALAWSMAIFKCSVLFSSWRCRIMFERKLVINASLTQSSQFWTASTDLKLHSFASNCSLCIYSSIFSSSFWSQVASKCRAVFFSDG